MASILLEPVVPNLTKISSGDHLRDLWRLFTKVKDCTQGGRRLENLYWRLWYQSTTTGNVKGQNICNLLETWKEDGDCLNVSKFKEASSLSRSESDNVSTTSAPAPAPALADVSPAPLVSSNVATVAPALTTSASTVTLVPPPVTHSIQISRASSALKVMAANANNVPAIPVAPAVPRTILPKKSSQLSNKGNLTPSRVSVGFSAAATTPAASSETGISEKPLQFNKAPNPSSTMAAVVQSKFANPKTNTPALMKTIEPFTPAPPAVSKMKTPEAPAKNVSKKKFFVEDSDSFDSMEGGLEESYQTSKTEQLLFEPVQEPTQQPVGTFLKIEPEPEFKPSNLSNLLRAPPRRVPNKFNPFATSNQNFRARNEDLNQTFESESIRRCLQLDRKPLFDPNVGFSSSSTSSFPASLPVW